MTGQFVIDMIGNEQQRSSLRHSLLDLPARVGEPRINPSPSPVVPQEVIGGLLLVHVDDNVSGYPDVQPASPSSTTATSTTKES